MVLIVCLVAIVLVWLAYGAALDLVPAGTPTS